MITNYWLLIIYSLSADFTLNNNVSLGYRQPNKSYSIGDIAYHSNLLTGYYLECTTAGTSASNDIMPSNTIGSTISDGTVVWRTSKSVDVNGGMLASMVDYYNSNDDGLIVLRGGNGFRHGAYMAVCGKDYTYEPRLKGSFELRADDGTDFYILTGNPNGNLMWNSSDLGGAAIVAKSISSNGYIKYSSGLLLQWSEMTCNGAYTPFPIAFSSTKRCMTAMTIPFGSNEFGAVVMEKAGYENDQFGSGLYCYNVKTNTMDSTKIARWIAIGF